MPVDRHPPRRASAEDPAVRQREQELRRARGEISCLECGRLKLKCDRKVPCSSCIRRNRAAMCPNGHAWSDQETRSLLSDTAQLHRKLSEMSQRIRQLEDALEISHSSTSSNSHPLLREELLAIKRGVGPSPAAAASANEGDSNDLGTADDEGTGEIEEAMGIMTISSTGGGRFIGRSGGSETLFLLGNKIAPPVTGRPEIDNLFKQKLGRTSDAWLLMPPNSSKEEVLEIINSNMPSFERAYSLAETYLENFSWVLRIVQRDQLFNELLPTQYKRLRLPQGDSNSTPMSPHDLALLLAVFAGGCLADLTLPPFNDEAEKYYQMALAALSVSPVLGAPSLAAIQALAILGAYNAHSGRTFSLDLTSSFFSLAVHLGISMGLHRDCEKWKVKSSVVERRRFIFWELFTADCWHNIANGKPASFSKRYCDSKYPEDIETRTLPNGVQEPSYWMFRHRFSSELVYPMIDLFCGLKPIRYHQILEHDRKISEFQTPQHLMVPASGSSMETDGPLLIMERMLPPVCRDALLMYIHRGYFAKALLDHPKDPLRSPYAHSYLSTYRSALSMLKVVREHYNSFPNLVSRFWSLWSHAFSAAVIIASIVIRGRSPDTVKAALAELNLAVSLFEKAAQTADRAKRSLPTLLRLREKAYEAAKQLENVSTLEPEKERVVVEGYDELMIFGGATKFFDKTKHKPAEQQQQSDVPPVPQAPSAMAAATSGMSSRSQSSADSAMFPSPLQQQADAIQGLLSMSGSSSSMATSPPTPEDLKNASGAVFPTGAWSGWSDQESLLINYLSSGVDMNAAANAAFATDADPMSFLWAANSPPDSQGSQTGSSPGTSQAQVAEVSGTVQQQQQQTQRVPSSLSTELTSGQPPVQEPNAFNVFSTGYAPPPPPGMKAAFEAEFGNVAFQQAQQQQRQQYGLGQGTGTSGWEGLLWGGSSFY